MSKHLVKTIVGLLALSVLSTSAQVVVSKSASHKLGVDLSGVQAGGGAAMAVRRTLENNINRSGWMEVAAPGKGAIIVRGTISESGGQVSFGCAVTDQAGQTYINATYAQPTPLAIYAAHQAANDIVTKVTGKPTFFLGKLVMIGVKSGAKELYLADSSAQDVRPLTQDRSIALKPRWSPDNRFIAYTSFLKRYPDVYTIELANGNRMRVASYPGVNSGGAISPDGRSMALILSKDGNPDLYVQDLATKRLVRLTHTPRATEGSPCWSPGRLPHRLCVGHLRHPPDLPPFPLRRHPRAPDVPRVPECLPRLGPQRPDRLPDPHGRQVPDRRHRSGRQAGAHHHPLRCRLRGPLLGPRWPPSGRRPIGQLQATPFTFLTAWETNP